MRRFLLLLGVLCLFAVPAKAQFIGYTSPQTVSFNKTALNCGSSTTAPNVGQSVHSLNYSVSLGTGTSSLVSIVGSNDGTTFFNIGHEGWGLNGQILGLGYSALVQVRLDCWVNGVSTTGAGVGTFSFQYSGTSVAPPGPVSGSLEPTIRKVIFLAAAAGTTQSISLGTPYGSTSGTLAFQYQSAGPASSTIAVKVADASLPSSTLQTFNLTTGTGLQKFQVNHFPVTANTAPGSAAQSPVTITYTAGGASASLFNLVYYFDPPGYTSTASGTSSTQVQGTAANGAATSGNPVLVAGSDGTSVRTLDVIPDNTNLPASAIVAIIGGIGGANGATGGNARGITACDQSAFVNVTTATTTQIVAFAGGQKVRVCSFSISNGSTAQTLIFKYGTGSACGTGTTSLTATFSLAPNQTVTQGTGLGELFSTTAGQQLCVANSSATQIGVTISYAQY